MKKKKQWRRRVSHFRVKELSRISPGCWIVLNEIAFHERSDNDAVFLEKPQ